MFGRMMSRLLCGAVLLSVFGVSASANADELLTSGLSNATAESGAHLSPLFAESESEAQVTSVSQLSDVQPTDWAFQALQSLVERYGCIAGYPDGTFRGNRAATRYELAAALNACLDQISDRFATKEDLETVKALQEEFKAELATLKGRVDGLEARTATLEAQQFSTTTKLNGEAIFALGGLVGEVANAVDTPIDANVTFTARSRLNLLTSFTGKDLLYTRLQSSTRPINWQGAAGTNLTRLSFDTGDTQGGVLLDRLSYMFPVGDKLKVTAFANAAFHHYYADSINPYFEGGGGGKGSISFFGERNPIYRIGTVGYPSTSGIGAAYDLSDKFRFDIGYLAGRSNQSVATPGNAVNPAGFATLADVSDSGLFGGSYSALAQLSYKPYDGGKVGLTYIRNYAPDGHMRYFTGSASANVPFVLNGVAQPLIGNSVGLEGTFKITPRFAVGGWFGYTNADRANGTGSADIINAAVNFAFPDLFKKGALGGLIVGLPPMVLNNSFDGTREDVDPAIHLEALYQFPINNNISITPGVIYLINPEGNPNSGDIFVGVLRTTFTF